MTGLNLISKFPLNVIKERSVLENRSNLAELRKDLSNVVGISGEITLNQSVLVQRDNFILVQGRVCGQGDLTARPHLLIFDLTQCLGPQALLSGCQTPQVFWYFQLATCYLLDNKCFILNFLPLLAEEDCFQ